MKKTVLALMIAGFTACGGSGGKSPPGPGAADMNGDGGARPAGDGGQAGGDAGSGTGALLSGADVGPGASLHGARVFPADNVWNRDISAEPVDPASTTLLAGCGPHTALKADFGTTYDGAPNGIPYIVVAGSQPKLPMNFVAYPDESDPGPYPVPMNAPIEGEPRADMTVAGGDRHVVVVDKDSAVLWELDNAFPKSGGATWDANCGAKFDLTSNAQRPAGWTSADAAGLPIFPGLVRYDEVVEQQVIRHALRFTCDTTRHAYVAPASHYASSRTDASYPPMGMRVRLKGDFDISRFPPPAQVILTALKKYGMLVADNGGAFFISGAPDPRWSDDQLATLSGVPTSALEVLKMGTVVTQ